MACSFLRKFKPIGFSVLPSIPRFHFHTIHNPVSTPHDLEGILKCKAVSMNLIVVTDHRSLSIPAQRPVFPVPAAYRPASRSIGVPRSRTAWTNLFPTFSFWTLLKDSRLRRQLSHLAWIFFDCRLQGTAYPTTLDCEQVSIVEALTGSVMV